MAPTRDPAKDQQVIASKTDLAKRLQAARASLGLSTRKVAGDLPDKLSLSHATIANYERGRTSPSMEVLAALADVYGRPVDWFFQSSQPLQIIEVYQRKKVSLADLQQFQFQAQRWLEAYLRLEHRLGASLPCRLPEIRRRLGRRRSPVALAEALREQLGLPKGSPVVSVVDLLEACSIRVIEVEGPVGIEAVSGAIGDEPILILNPATSDDRSRLLGAQECGHLLMSSPRNRGRRVSEEKAYTFASHLLLPDADLARGFSSRSVVELLSQKHRFGIPLSAIMLRAEVAGLIDAASMRLIARRLAKRGWLKRESDVMLSDRAVRFERLIEMAMFAQKLKWAELEAITGFSRDDLEGRLESVLSRMIGRIEAPAQG